MTAPVPLLLSCEGFLARPQLTRHAENKAATLLRHTHPRLARVSLHVRHEASRAGAPAFIACATVEKNGVIHVAHAAARDPQPAITAALGKLGRDLQRSSTRRRDQRRAPLESITDFLET